MCAKRERTSANVRDKRTRDSNVLECVCFSIYICECEHACACADINSY